MGSGYDTGVGTRGRGSGVMGSTTGSVVIQGQDDAMRECED